MGIFERFWKSGGKCGKGLNCGASMENLLGRQNPPSNMKQEVHERNGSTCLPLLFLLYHGNTHLSSRFIVLKGGPNIMS